MVSLDRTALRFNLRFHQQLLRLSTRCAVRTTAKMASPDDDPPTEAEVSGMANLQIENVRS